MFLLELQKRLSISQLYWHEKTLKKPFGVWASGRHFLSFPFKNSRLLCFQKPSHYHTPKAFLCKQVSHLTAIHIITDFLSDAWDALYYCLVTTWKPVLRTHSHTQMYFPFLFLCLCGIYRGNTCRQKSRSWFCSGNVRRFNYVSHKLK